MDRIKIGPKERALEKVGKESLNQRPKGRNRPRKNKERSPIPLQELDVNTLELRTLKPIEQ